MTQIALPPVAKSFFTLCKKCDVERYHTVLTHTSATAAKIECEVCHAKRTYNLPKSGAAKKKAAGNGVKKTAARRTSHADEYNRLLTDTNSDKGVPFNIRTKFELNQKIDHSKFGPGFVKAVLIDRVDVMFQDELKTLMHNKK